MDGERVAAGFVDGELSDVEISIGVPVAGLLHGAFQGFRSERDGVAGAGGFAARRVADGDCVCAFLTDQKLPGRRIVGSFPAGDVEFAFAVESLRGLAGCSGGHVVEIETDVASLGDDYRVGIEGTRYLRDYDGGGVIGGLGRERYFSYFAGFLNAQLSSRIAEQVCGPDLVADSRKAQDVIPGTGEHVQV